MRSSFMKLDYDSFNRDNLNKILSKLNLRNPKILYLSTYGPKYTRTESLLSLFKSNNINCDTFLIGNSSFKYVRTICHLILSQKKYDLIFVGFRGQELLPLIKLFSKKPLIFDAFVSVYDTLCFDRKGFRPNSLIGKFLKRYDKFLCDISDIVLVDTKAHKDYFEKTFGVSNVNYLYVGCNNNLFKPSLEKDKNNFLVFWYGNSNPLQGVDVILKSIKLLENEAVYFKLVGPVRKKYSKLIKELDLKNVQFLDYVSYEKLPMEINKSDLCLGGHFSDIDKAKRVIAGKTFQFLSCGKLTILGDNISNKELFHDKGLVSFVKLNDEKALANKILKLKEKYKK